MKFGGIEDSHVRKARAHFHAVRTLRELVSKENINFVRMRAINSKKIEKKNQKIWKFMGLKIFRFARCVHVFVVFGHRRSSWRKKTNFSSKKFEKMQYFVFFSRAPRTSFDHQNLQAPCALKPLWRQINSIFLNFFAIFFEFTVHRHKLFLFSFTTSSRSVQPTQKCARALRTWLSSIPPNFIFFDFFAIFFWMVRVLWPDGNGAKGHFYKWH